MKKTLNINVLAFFFIFIHFLHLISHGKVDGDGNKFPDFVEKEMKEFEVYYKFGKITTDFHLLLPTLLLKDRNRFWIALGFNSVNKMDNSTAVVCRYTTTFGNSVYHYFNDQKRPVLVNGNSPTLGLSNSKITHNGTWTQCSFTRKNVEFSSRYFNIAADNQPYLLVAYGSLDGPNLSICFIFLK